LLCSSQSQASRRRSSSSRVEKSACSARSQPLLDFQAHLLEQVVASPVLGHRPLHPRTGDAVHLRIGVAQRQIQQGFVDDQGVAGLGERHRAAEQALVFAAVAVGRVPEVHRHGVELGAQNPAAEHHRAGVEGVHPVRRGGQVLEGGIEDQPEFIIVPLEAQVGEFGGHPRERDHQFDGVAQGGAGHAGVAQLAHEAWPDAFAHVQPEQRVAAAFQGQFEQPVFDLQRHPGPGRFQLRLAHPQAHQGIAEVHARVQRGVEQVLDPERGHGQ
jgi:hypothetical protein